MMVIRNSSVGLVVLLAVMFFGGTVVRAAPLQAQACERVSENDNGQGGDGPSSGPAIDADGQVVAYFSNAPNLTCSDRNAVRDVFVRNRVARHTSRTSLASDTTEANGASQPGGSSPAITADGLVVAFSSTASNLVSNDSNGLEDLFLRTRESDASCPEIGTTVRLSMAFDGNEANGPSSHPDLSADGCCVAFQSLASNLVDHDPNQDSDIFLYDCQSQRISLLSTAADGAPANGDSTTPAVSGDCRFVAFASAATNLVDGDTNRVTDIFVRELATGRIQRVSVDSAGLQANATSYFPSLNFDGAVVAFKSDATNLVPSDTNGVADVFAHDRLGGQTQRVSVDSSGNEANDFSGPPKLSGNGRFVAFPSWASNLVSDDRNGFGDIFVYDRGTQTIDRITCDTEPNGGVPDLAPSISQDGEWVAFASGASNLVPNDVNNALDVFVARRALCASDADCDDGNLCTTNRCNLGTGSCLYEATEDGTPCADELFCNGAETCHAGVCTPPAAPVCGECQVCAEADRRCDPLPNGTSCTDDGRACTTDTCTDGACTHPIDGGQCLIDGLCLGDDAVNPSNPCQYCDAGVTQSTWSNAPNGTSCTDEIFCNGPETCQAGVCEPGPTPCPPSTCDENTRQCRGTAAATPSPTPTRTGSPAGTPTYTGSPVATPTATGSPVATPTATGSPVATPTATGSPVATPTATGSPEAAVSLDHDACHCEIHPGARGPGFRFPFALLPPALLLMLRRRAGRPGKPRNDHTRGDA